MHSLLLAASLSLLSANDRPALKPIPERLVVLTFDDSCKSHYTIARPILKKHGFGATFFITEGFDFPTNKRDFMTWGEIAELHRDGFEIGNHTKDHLSVSAKRLSDLAAQVRGINASCKKHGIPEPTTFAYPGNGIHPGALPILKSLGIRFARRGGEPEYTYKQGRGSAYEPGLDHPLLVPSTGDARPGWTLDDFKRAVHQARHGKIAVLQFHGVPDTAHDWVSTPKARFEQFLQYLADEKYTVIALRDLARYVDPNVVPSDPWGVIEDRKKLLSAGKSPDNFRSAKSDEELRYWLGNAMHHGFDDVETSAALGTSATKVRSEMKRLGIDRETLSKRPSDRLFVLPYPGGRHPRIGFLDGAIRPQRDTKVSIFAPWKDGGYAVADVPEAIWHNVGKGRELLYLAHTHVPTIWDRRNVSLAPTEWKVEDDGTLKSERTLPNQVRFGAVVHPEKSGVRLELWLTNGSKVRLTGLQVQNCVMLKSLTGFSAGTNDNKVLDAPFAACHDESGQRWILTAWEPCVRAWGNPPCPCLHSDPKIPDCAPGETQRVRGWVSFYEGKNVRDEFKRLRSLAPWKK